jgi:ankyrin repeat protein
MKFTLFLLALSINSLRADVNAATERLVKASRVGDLKTVETFLSSGLNPDLPDRYGRTPLYYAASFNETKVVELLLAYHANPNAPITSESAGSEFPISPLQNAASMGNLRATSMLLASGAEIEAKGATGRTALHFAALGVHLDVLQLLIEKGADLNARDAAGTSPLDNAVWRGQLDAAAILLAHGARLNEVETKTGATPINEAAYRGNTQLVRYLLQFNPDLDIPDKRGYRPLENAIRAGAEDSALLLLEAEPKQPETAQLFGRSMDAAIKKDESLLVEALLRHGVSPNTALASGATPLDAAAFEGALNVVRVLLKNNADPNMSGRNGTSPLEDASLKGFEPIAALLLDHGASLNHLNGDSGATALYAAASFGKSGVVKLLLERGANPALCGKNRKSPYQAALENGYNDVATQLQAHGGAKTCQ